MAKVSAQVQFYWRLCQVALRLILFVDIVLHEVKEPVQIVINARSHAHSERVQLLLKIVKHVILELFSQRNFIKLLILFLFLLLDFICDLNISFFFLFSGCAVLQLLGHWEARHSVNQITDEVGKHVRPWYLLELLEGQTDYDSARVLLNHRINFFT